MTAKTFLKLWLAVVYPVSSVACGLLVWWAITVSIPEEPHPVAYGVGTALALAAYMYGHSALWYFRKKRRERAKL